MQNTLDSIAPGGVYLCQVNESVSCGACCGLYNVDDPSRDTLISMLSSRTDRFRFVPRDSLSIGEYAENTQKSQSDNKPFKGFHHCPFIGFMEPERNIVGCLLHPDARGNNGVDFRGLSYYGGFACHGYFCPAHSMLTSEYKKIARAAADDWYVFGLVITETSMLKTYFQSAEKRLGRPLTAEQVIPNERALKAVRDFFDLKITWPFRKNRFNRLGCYFFKDSLNPVQKIDYAALGCPPSVFTSIFEALGSSFTHRGHVREAEDMIHDVIEHLVNALFHR